MKMRRHLTGTLLADILSGAAGGAERGIDDEDIGFAIFIQEILYEAAEMAREHGDEPVDLEIAISRSGRRGSPPGENEGNGA